MVKPRDNSCFLGRTASDLLEREREREREIAFSIICCINVIIIILKP